MRRLASLQRSVAIDMSKVHMSEAITRKPLLKIETSARPDPLSDKIRLP